MTRTGFDFLNCGRGVSFRPTPDWNRFDLDWTTGIASTLCFSDKRRATLPAIQLESGILYEFGISQLPAGFILSVYVYSENSVPNEFQPLNTSSNRHILSAGIAQVGDRLWQRIPRVRPHRQIEWIPWRRHLPLRAML
jgi:hypothetical protein